MIPLPGFARLPVSETIALFVLGWIFCAGVSHRWLGRRSAALGIAVGFLAWNALIAQWGIVLGVTKLYTRTAFLAGPPVLAALLALVFWRHPIQDLRAVGRGLARVLLDPLGAAVTVAIAVILTILGFHTATYPADSWDTYQYHRVISLLYLQEGRLFDLPASYYPINHYPKNAQLVAAWMLGLARWETPARLLPLANVAAMILAVFSALRSWRATPGEAAWMSISVVAAPVVLVNIVRDTGYIDVQVATAFCIGIAVLLDLVARRQPGADSPVAAADPSPPAATATTSRPTFRAFLAGDPVVRSSAVAALSVAQLTGLKANGFLYGGVIGGLALLALFLTRNDATGGEGAPPAPRPAERGSGNLLAARIACLVAFVGACTLLLGAYWLAYNQKYMRNPLYPAIVKIGDRLVFEGRYHASDIMSVDLPKQLERKSASSRFWRSVHTENPVYFVWNTRLGGWGPQFAWLGMWAWALGILVAAARRDTWAFAVLGSCAALFWFMPSNWWARFVIFFIVLSPLGAIVIAETAARWPATRWFRPLLIGAWGGLGLFGFGSGYVGVMEANLRVSTREAASADRRWYMIPQDAFRANYEQDSERELYRWVAANLPRDARVAFHSPLGFPFAAYLFRADYRNTIREVDAGKPEQFKDSADFLVTGVVEPMTAPARALGWVELYRNAVFTVFRRSDYVMPTKPDRLQRAREKPKAPKSAPSPAPPVAAPTSGS